MENIEKQENYGTMPQDYSEVIKTDITKEYIAGGFYNFLGKELFRTLPHYIDDLTAELGDDIYERMILDPYVSSAVNLIKLSVLSSRLSIVPKITDPLDPNFERAKEMSDFVSECFDELDKPITQVLFEMLDSLYLGNKVSEVVYENRKDKNGKLRTFIKYIKVKPRKTTAFVVDAYMQVVGMLGVLPEHGMNSIASQYLGQQVIEKPETQPVNLLSRDKFFVFSFRTKDNNPKGTSILRQAYNSWWIKVQIYPEYIKYLTQFASPSLHGTTAEGANAEPKRDAEGNVIYDAEGNPILVSPETKMFESLVGFKNGTLLVTPFGSEVEPINNVGDGSAFLNAFQMLNTDITKAILYQTLATGEAQFQARASSETHQDIIDMLIRQIKEDISHAIERDIIRILIRENYGKEAMFLLPQVQFTETEAHNFSSDVNAIVALFSSGYLDEGQIAELDARLGLAKREKPPVIPTKAVEQNSQPLLTKKDE